MESFDTELFIQDVKKRPALYNIKLKEYSNKILKKELWTEICQLFIENWSRLSDKDKSEKGKL